MAAPLQSDDRSLTFPLAICTDKWPCWIPPATTHQWLPRSSRPSGIGTAWRRCLSSLAANAAGREGAQSPRVSSQGARDGLSRRVFHVVGGSGSGVACFVEDKSCKFLQHGSLRTCSHEPVCPGTPVDSWSPCSSSYVNQHVVRAGTASKTARIPRCSPVQIEEFAVRLYQFSSHHCLHCTIASSRHPESPLRDTSKCVIGTSFFSLRAAPVLCHRT